MSTHKTGWYGPRVADLVVGDVVTTAYAGIYIIDLVEKLLAADENDCEPIYYLGWTVVDPMHGGSNTVRNVRTSTKYFTNCPILWLSADGTEKQLQSSTEHG